VEGDGVRLLFKNRGVRPDPTTPPTCPPPPGGHRPSKEACIGGHKHTVEEDEGQGAGESPDAGGDIGGDVQEHRARRRGVARPKEREVRAGGASRRSSHPIQEY